MKKSSPSWLGLVIVAGIILGLAWSWFSSLDLLPVPTPTLGPAALEMQSILTPAAVPIPTRVVSLPKEAEASPHKAGIGLEAPDFSLPDRDGDLVSLSDFRGKVVVINFWASWCPPCRYEMPGLQALSEKYAESLVVMGVNTTYVDVRRDAQVFIDDLDLTFPILFDETGEVGEKLYTVMSLPTSYWVDRDGIIRSIQIGAMTAEKMEITLNELLQEI